MRGDGGHTGGMMRGPGRGDGPGPRIGRNFDGGRKFDRRGPGPEFRSRGNRDVVIGDRGVRRWVGPHDGRHWDGRHWRRGGVIIGSGYWGYPWYDDYYYDDDDGGYYVTTADGDEIQRCRERYRSFDEATGTFLGYDGERHVCPYLR